ncbi:MAG TPA: glutamate--tRNA ligase family protein [Candidatus Dormibacteraeota bacterium]|nr:glutamate--tRNA ligase family protein [Candidatus Dormibacteraeota bacterium]
MTEAGGLEAALPAGATTRFAPAPTGRLHLGHLANAIFVWGLARRAGGRVLLRIEDHDQQRCRPEYEAALLDDLDRLGIAPDEPSTDDFRRGPTPHRQSDNGDAYAAAVDGLRARALAYACDCSRSTFDAWQSANGRAWSGAGCPAGCRDRRLVEAPGMTLRVALGDGDESWVDVLRGPSSGPATPAGDLAIRDRNNNWTYGLCVVVDDLRHGVDLVVRGEDLLDATPAQIRLGRLLGRDSQPTFAHHRLVRRSDGTKLSKAGSATALGERLDAGRSPEELIGEATRAVGLSPVDRPITFDEALALVP